MRLQTNVEESSGVPIVRVAGEIDVFTAPSFKSAVSRAIESKAGDLIIDLTDVGYMDSSGFGTLLSATKRIKPVGGSVILVGCSEAIERMLNITHLDTIFAVCSNLDEAMASINS